ncbi:MAG: phosphoribosylformylglycinamidine synthase subunit PurQ [Candidatus Methylomirabilales bacterium]
MRFGILVFPGSWSHQDFYWVLKDLLGYEAVYIWHKETDLKGSDCLILPGGFSYGDYLRTGAIARFSPAVKTVAEFAEKGGLVLGSCNGFQILCEAGLLPGALMRNSSLEYRCQWVYLRVENSRTPFTLTAKEGQVLKMPISHGEGRYYADPETLKRLKERGQIVFRYSTSEGEIAEAANPNGSLENIAGICNDQGNVLGLMPHPERASESILGSEDGRLMFESIVKNLSSR